MWLKTDLTSKFDWWIKDLESKGWENLRRVTRLRNNIESFDETEDADILSSIERLWSSITANSK